MIVPGAGKGAAFIAEATVEGLGGGGDGVATLADGRRAFLPYAAPGDLVRARFAPARGGELAGTVTEVLRPGEGRAEPVCPHFGTCGGCTLQHLEDGLYAAWKRETVIKALARHGLDDVPVEPLVRIPAATRRRARFTARRGGGGAVAIGFYARGTHRIVDIGVCAVLESGLVALIAPLRELLARLLSPGDKAEIAVNGTDSGLDVVIIAAADPSLDQREALVGFANAQDLARLSWQRAAPAATIPETVVERRTVRQLFSGVPVALPPRAFLQASPAGEAALVELVTEGVGEAKRIADLFAGAGTFTFALAGRARVHAVEASKPMAEALRQAANRSNLAHAIEVSVRDLMARPLTGDELAPFDAVVFDPPRAGAKASAAALGASGVGRVVAASCNAASFARDARILVDGGYRLDRVVAVDQFRWTPHLEIVASFTRRA
jgi:23S rRNA (uracil1939-C5)-methyltransferase